MGKLNGRVALITGAGRGIGQATAELFAREGAVVVVATRSEAPGAETVASIIASGGEAILEVVDVGDRDVVRGLVERVTGRYGRLDIILHNAAYFDHSSIKRMRGSALDKMFDVGVKAAFWLMQDAIPWLEKSEAPRFLLTSSIAGNQRAIPGQVHYGAMKMAANGFIRGAALELAGRRITVNGIEPGVIRTYAISKAAPDAILDATGEAVPLGRLGEAEDIARGFLFLASDDASYITGQTIIIDGGMSLGDKGGLFTSAS